MATRQREYQKRQKANGLCIQCPTPALPKKGRCFRHHLFYKLRQYGMACGHVNERTSNQREKLCAHLTGRFAAVSAGYLEPGDENQRVKDALEIRLRLNIKWGGVRGSRKLAAVLRSFDRLAMQIRKEREHERHEQNTPA